MSRICDLYAKLEKSSTYSHTWLGLYWIASKIVVPLVYVQKYIQLQLTKSLRTTQETEEWQEDFDIRVNKINLVNIILLDDFVINKSSNIFTVVEKTLLNKVLNFANRIKSAPKCKVITSIESGIQIRKMWKWISDTMFHPKFGDFFIHFTYLPFSLYPD
jgi:hypothetical protein